MIDIKWIRENPEAFDAALKRRGLEPLGEQLQALDKKHRHAIAALQQLQEEKNENAKNMGLAKREKGNIDPLIEEGSRIKKEMAEKEHEATHLANELQGVLNMLPNVVADDIPQGTCEADNLEIKQHLTPSHFDFAPKAHYDLGEALGLMSFEEAATMAGSRFVVLKGALARLERALGQFMLETHTTQFGYEEISPPLLVKGEAFYHVGLLPKFGEEAFQTTDGRWLIPTAEVSLTNLAAGQLYEEKNLPKRYTALTPCFRSEAGAAGKDTRGMLRQHQFHKVELVSITHPDHEKEEHERMLEAAETILQKLALPYRVVVLCDGDIGFQSQKTYDIEVWCPGQEAYREISSCSRCGDFQARRMNARFRPHTMDNKKVKPQFVHTLNGSGLAVGRTLIAVMENYQQKDGTIRIPDVLKPYMKGLDVIKAHTNGER